MAKKTKQSRLKQRQRMREERARREQAAAEVVPPINISPPAVPLDVIQAVPLDVIEAVPGPSMTRTTDSPPKKRLAVIGESVTHVTTLTGDQSLIRSPPKRKSPITTTTRQETPKARRAIDFRDLPSTSRVDPAPPVPPTPPAVPSASVDLRDFFERQGKAKGLRGAVLKNFVQKRIRLAKEQPLPPRQTDPVELQHLLRDLHINDNSSLAQAAPEVERVLEDVLHGTGDVQFDYDAVDPDAQDIDPPHRTGQHLPRGCCPDVLGWMRPNPTYQSDIVVAKQHNTCVKNHRGLGCAAVSARHYPDYYNSGTYGDNVCAHCQAQLLRTESSQICCTGGRVSLRPLSEFPTDLYNLVQTNKNYVAKQRHYNNLMQFASITTTHGDPAPGLGPQPVILNGEFDRRIGGLRAPAGQTPKFGQLYILSSEEALENRSGNPYAREQNLDRGVLLALDEIIRRVHPLAEAFQTFHRSVQQHVERVGSVPKYTLTLLNEWEIPESVEDRSLHPRQVNLPYRSEGLFMIWDASTDLPPLQRGVWISSELEGLKTLQPFHPVTDTACYPLLFPRGDSGFRFGISLNENVSPEEDAEDVYDVPTERRKFVSVRQYYKYRLAIRDGQFNPIWASGGGLGQKFVLDISARIDHQVAEHIRKAQQESRLRSALPESVLQFLERGLQPGQQLGKVVLFNPRVPGTRPYFRRAFNDAATIMQNVRRRGCCTFLLTFTSNPNWPEVKQLLFPNGQSVLDRPDALVRVYKDKVKLLHHELDKSTGILGNILGYAESMEFQKRGGPHLHRVMATEVPNTPTHVDDYVCAEIPPYPPAEDDSEGAEKQRRLRELVIKHQLHTCREELCGGGGVGKTCKKGFPKPFSNRTILYDDRHAIFKRRDPKNGGVQAEVKVRNNLKFYTNQHVVPYNPYILQKYETHHNLEYVYGEMSSMKYALKYPFKGASYTYVRGERQREGEPIVMDYDEPAEYAKCVFRSASEAYARMIGMKYVQKSHAVYDLTVHLPHEQRVYFREGLELETAQRLERGAARKTQLLAYFEAMAKYEGNERYANTLYRDMPLHFSFSKGEWKERQRTIKVLGYVYPVSPSNVQLFALYSLLMHTSAKSYEQLRTVGDRLYDTFAEAARARGLLRDDDLWRRTLRDGADRLNPREMRRLFVSVVLFGLPAEPLRLWEEFVSHMYDGRGATSEAERSRRVDRALRDINYRLQFHGRSLAAYGLPVPRELEGEDVNRRVDDFYFPDALISAEDGPDETAPPTRPEDTYSRLNAGQKSVVDALERALSASVSDRSVPRLFFLTGDGGTGKTFLYNTAIRRFRGKGKRILATAATGIAATLLSSGTTFHSAFRMGINIEADTPCPHDADSYFANRIRRADLLILDEAPMLHRKVVECAERWCRELAAGEDCRNVPFGGKVVLFGGDWKQLLPVVAGHGVMEQFTACFKTSPLYRLFTRLNLTENMRLSEGEQQFSLMLSDIGNGSSGESVRVPPEMVVHGMEELIAFVFQDTLGSEDVSQLLTRMILACRNEDVDRINETILERIPQPETTYLSSDVSRVDCPLAVNAREHEVDVLNTLTPPGLPKHELIVKKGSVIVLLKNINITEGLCNGTRLYVRDLTDSLIVAEALTGSSAGRGMTVALGKSVFEYKEDRPDGIHFERLQFPVRLAFAMTVNKAQGQTLTRLGIDLTNEVFSHGQLYTAFSRVRTMGSLRVFAPHSSVGGDTKLNNIVLRNVL